MAEKSQVILTQTAIVPMDRGTNCYNPEKIIKLTANLKSLIKLVLTKFSHRGGGGVNLRVKTHR